ncbi:hypothetical protein MJO29_002924, partial [Puccinia striiformis f. sp. tritici]
LGDKAKTSMRDIHKGLNSLKRLTCKQQLSYMTSRIVVGWDEQRVDGANKFILGIMKRPARLLSIGQTKRSQAIFLSHSVKTQRNSVPNDIIPVQRGIVLWILENNGNKSYLNRGKRVLLLQIGLIYHLGREGEKSNADRIQFPVVAVFAVIANDVDYSCFPAVLKI